MPSMQGKITNHVFPAHAGMNRMSYPSEPLLESVPRTRGDEPGRGDPWQGERSVPRTRGDEPAKKQLLANGYKCSPKDISWVKGSPLLRVRSGKRVYYALDL